MTLEVLEKQFYNQMILNGFNPIILNTVNGEYTSTAIKGLWICWEQCARVNNVLKGEVKMNKKEIEIIVEQNAVYATEQWQVDNLTKLEDHIEEQNKTIFNLRALLKQAAQDILEQRILNEYIQLL